MNQKNKAAYIKPLSKMILVSVFDENEGPSGSGKFYHSQGRLASTKAGVILALGEKIDKKNLKVGMTIFFKPEFVETVDVSGDIYSLIEEEKVLAYFKNEKEN